MRIASTIARYLLGLIFTVFGLNGFLHFLPMPAPTGLAGQFMGALFQSHYLVVVFLLQLIGGVLLLSGFYVPLGLTLLAPVIVNIVCYHSFMDPGGLPMAIVVAVLWFVAYLGVRPAFAGLLQARATSRL
jgi:putative oxidoreductase